MGPIQNQKKYRNWGLGSPTKGSNAIPNLFPQPVPSVYAGGTGLSKPAGGVPSSGWPGTGRHGKIKLLVASWLSPACPPSHCPHANREAQQAASAFGFWRPHLQPSWPSSLPLTASPKGHQLGHFPTDTGASKEARKNVSLC